MPTFSTLCSGGELFGVGVRAAGWRHVRGYEIDPKIAAVAQLNDFDVRAADVCQIDFASEPEVDHKHASPSCKTASRANANGGETAGDLAVADAICRAIRAHAGRTFTLENVVGYRWYESLDRICQALHECGFTFPIITKGGERPTWRESIPVWNDAGEFLDAADFGVPQNRKRLWLRAVRGGRVPHLWPTHAARAGVLVERWVGWYQAIEDIIQLMPTTTPAPWQLARMPAELRETLLFHQGISKDHQGNEYETSGRGAADPAYTITSNGNQLGLRAWIVAGGNTNLSEVESHARADDLPMFTVAASDGSKKAAAAYLLTGENAGGGGEGWRRGDAPAFTTTASNKGVTRAFLIGGQYATNNTRPDRYVQTADQGSPSRTVTPGAAKDTRCFVGEWRRLTIRHLARLQSVPDEYRGLTSEINGNGVPPLMAERIMESLRQYYE